MNLLLAQVLCRVCVEGACSAARTRRPILSAHPSAYPVGHCEIARPPMEEPVGGAPHPCAPTVEHMRGDLRGAHVTVSQEFLDGADVVPVLQQVGRTAPSTIRWRTDSCG